MSEREIDTGAADIDAERDRELAAAFEPIAGDRAREGVRWAMEHDRAWLWGEVARWIARMAAEGELAE